MNVRIVNNIDQLPRVSGMVDALAAARNIAAAATADMQVALDEVLSNIIKYGYVDTGEHEIDVSLEVVGDVLEAKVIDDGVEFDPLATAPPYLASGLHERRVGGLGIHFARALMTEVLYARRDGRNHVTLRKRL
jgi:anti-sigma regulatory factor (Ser/Thr protein kinase)